jgi:hypothetical protein
MGFSFSLSMDCWRRALAGLLVLLIWILPGAEAMAQPNNIQPYIDRVAEKISEFTLSNGMKFIVMERHQSPTVSFMTYVDVGSAYEQPQKTGAAHFLEHLAFKGTTQIGTQDFQAEQPLLSELDLLADQIKTAKAAGQSVTELQQKFDQTCQGLCWLWLNHVEKEYLVLTHRPERPFAHWQYWLKYAAGQNH